MAPLFLIKHYVYMTKSLLMDKPSYSSTGREVAITSVSQTRSLRLRGDGSLPKVTKLVSRTLQVRALFLELPGRHS